MAGATTAPMVETHAAKKLVLDCQMSKKVAPIDQATLKGKCAAVPIEDKENTFIDEVCDYSRLIHATQDLQVVSVCLCMSAFVRVDVCVSARVCVQNTCKPKDGKRKLRRLGQAPPLVDDTF